MRQPSLSGLISSTACAGAFDPGDASRYLTLIWVPERAGVWLFARNGEWPGSDMSDVVVRRWDRCDADLLAAPACRASAHNVTAPGDLDSENLAHNAAAAWYNGTLLLIGGRYNHAGREFERRNRPQDEQRYRQRGVLLYEAPLADAHHAAGLRRSWRTRLLMDGSQAAARHCIEARVNFRGRCQFDGHFSIAARRVGTGREWLLYARANIAAGTPAGAGGRHVQVTRSLISPYGPWSDFELLQFGSWNATDPVLPERNVYLPCVKRHPIGPTGVLLGLFPYYDRARAFIGMAISCDGVRFSELEPFATAPQGLLGRIAHLPVDGWIAQKHSEHVHFFIHHNVPGIARSGVSSVVRHSVAKAALKNHTGRAMRTLPSCARFFGHVR